MNKSALATSRPGAPAFDEHALSCGPRPGDAADVPSRGGFRSVSSALPDIAGPTVITTAPIAFPIAVTGKMFAYPTLSDVAM